MSYDIKAVEVFDNDGKVIGSLRGIKSDQCVEQVLRALIHAGYEVTIQEKREKEKVQALNCECERPQAACVTPSPMNGVEGAGPFTGNIGGCIGDGDNGGRF